MKTPFTWDNYSDQPAQLKDKAYKKLMRQRELMSLLKTIFLSLIMLPITLVLMPFVKRKEIQTEEFFCLGVEHTRHPKDTLIMLQELDISRVLLRLKLWELQELSELKTFILSLKNKKVTLKILQDREHIEDLELLKKDLFTIFTELEGLIDMYEIGATINRAKWGFFSVNEYLRFYEVAFKLKQENFTDIKLIGSGVIDFEYHFTLHTLFNFFKIKYDGTAALLYVDRRGAPENLQFIFALADKIAWLSTIVWLSPKSSHDLHITETNWPLSGTAPYAPTSEHECVSEKLYADYMLRYHLLAFASQQVNTLSWHQLIASGYGLVDERKGLLQREAYNVYKFMVHTFKHAQFLRLDIKRDYYILQALINERVLQVHWSLKETTLKNEDFFECFDMNGKVLKDEILAIGSSPIYIYIIKEVPKKINCL